MQSLVDDLSPDVKLTVLGPLARGGVACFPIVYRDMENLRQACVDVTLTGREPFGAREHVERAVHTLHNAIHQRPKE